MRTLLAATTGPMASRWVGCFAYCAVLIGFVSFWRWKVTGGMSLEALLVFALIAGLSFAYGQAFLRLTTLPPVVRSSLNLRFLTGFLCVNSLLFVLSIASPLSVPANAVLVSAIAALLAWWQRGRPADPVESRRAPELVALLLSATGATIWCSDGLEPIVRDGSNTIFRLWSDSYVHARIISSFAQGHGFATLSDIRLSATPTYLYHYAGYAVPAVIHALTETGAYEVFASFMLPFGIVLTGIAAFSFGRFLWGAWPGVAATIAIVFIPDAYQQGFGNKYLSYNFMQQVNIAGLYGVACATVAWIFVLDGCQRGKPGSIAVGWVFALVTLYYKAHVFVANSFLILIYPCLFYPRLGPRWRIAVGAALVALFFLAGSLSELIERAPTLRLDGSGALQYMRNLAWNYEPGLPGSFFDRVFRQQLPTVPAVVLYGSAMLLLSTFGGWILAAAVVGASIRRSTPPAVLLFPFLVVVNYLIMALGLAMDTRGIGSPDELLNRPLVWAYFVVAAWTGGAGYFLLLGDRLPSTVPGRVAVVCALVLCLVGPVRHSTNLQTYARWPGFETYAAANTVPTCLVSAARFIRDHSRTDAVLQDSENDPRFLVTALAERQGFTSYAENRPPKEMDVRMRDLVALRSMTTESGIVRFAADRGIDWYLLRPSTEVAWPASLLQTAVFECGGFRVYRFDR